MDLSHESHEHPLSFVDGESETDELVPCSCCQNDICGARYSCFACSFHLHKSCAELPPRLEHHPFHPEHPLALRPRSTNTGGYSCDACNVHADGFIYYCYHCDFALHTMCAVSVYQKENIFSERIGGRDLFRYGAHQHLLMLREEQSASTPNCFVCSGSISAPFFSCSKSRCTFRLHKFCADLPQILHDNSFHPQHPLFLSARCSDICQLCSVRSSSAYICKPCHFFIDPKCALSNPVDNLTRVGEKQIQHFTHQHWLTLLQDEGEYAEIEKHLRDCSSPQDEGKLAWRRTPYCNLCRKEVASFPRYDCRLCPFSLHESCAELPPQIKSHLHLDHVLFLFARPPGGKAITYCDYCAAKINNFNYRCVQCGFMLHVNCFLSQHGSEKLSDHKHCFINLKNFHKLTCQTCGEEGYFSPWQCSSCHIMVHRKCVDLPRILRLRSHQHNLNLTYYLSLGHECDNMMKCRLCFKRVNIDYAAYYCSKCDYAAHPECALKISGNNTGILVEDNKSVKIERYSHKHGLTLIEQELEDDKYCEGCVVRLIIPPFYRCKECNFYLHKKCGESLNTMEHPLHGHPLTLNVVEEPSCCSKCQNRFNGFMYKCKTRYCTFILDLQCADIFSEGLQHPCHEHPLNFPYTLRNYENCKGCGKMQEHILVCSECNDYALGYCCLRIPHVAKHRYDDHLLNLSYKNKDESDEYYCDICEEERDPETWFYSCSQCEFFAHIDCTLGEFPHIKYGTTLKFSSHDHPLILVEKCKRKPPPLCSSCGKHCYSRVLECCQCNIHFHFCRPCTSYDESIGLFHVVDKFKFK